MSHRSPSGNEAKYMTCGRTRRILDNGAASVSFVETANFLPVAMPAELRSHSHRSNEISQVVQAHVSGTQE